MASIENSYQMVDHLKDEGFFVSLLVRRSEILKPFAHDVLQEQLAEKDILIDALKEESRCLGVVDLILQLVKDERSKERPSPRVSKADTKLCTGITWQSCHLCLQDSKDEARRDYAHRDGNERSFAG